MTTHHEIRVRGKNLLVPAVSIDGNTVVRLGRCPVIARFADEELVQGRPVRDLGSFCAAVRQSGLGADLLTINSLHCSGGYTPGVVAEAESLAVIHTESFDQWWTSELSQDGRKNVRRAEKKGVVVEEADLDAAFVSGIKEIYDETPVRQGRRFWHFGKSLDDVRKENETYAERSWFLGAFVGSALVGFIKVIEVDEFGHLIQILSKQAEQDRRPTNALIAAAVKRCEARGLKYLVYGNYRYGAKGDDSLSEFKRRNGFRELEYSRLYVPLNGLGRFIVAAGLHKGFGALLPRQVAVAARSIRARLVGFGLRSPT
jgi:hypothetical protein